MINPGLFFLFIILILPGFFALVVFNSITAKATPKQSLLNLTYNSIIHSLFIFIILYVIWYPKVYHLGLNIFDNKQLIKYISDYLTQTPWIPLIMTIKIMLISLVYGIIYALLYRFQVLNTILLFFLKKSVEPPNILADIIDKKYGAKTNMWWLTFKHKEILYSGCIHIAKLDQEPKEFLLENILILNPNTREPEYQYPEGEYIWLKVDDSIALLELKPVLNDNNNEDSITDNLILFFKLIVFFIFSNILYHVIMM